MALSAHDTAAPSNSPGPVGGGVLVAKGQVASSAAAAALSDRMLDDVLNTDDGDGDVDGDGWSSPGSSDCTSLESVWSGAGGTQGADGPGVNVDKLKMVNSTAQIGNINNYKGPVTVVVTNEANNVGCVSMPAVLSPGGGLVLSAGTLKHVVSQEQLLAPTNTGSAPTTPAAETNRALKKFLRWPCVTVPVTMLVAALGLVVTVVLVSLPRADGIIELKNGVKLAKRSFWHARNPKKPADILRTPVDIVIINHSGTEFCFDAQECIDRISMIQSYNMDSVNRSWDDIAYNYMIGGDGVTYEGRGWDAVGAHVKGWNSKSLGVGIIGNFTWQTPTDVQRDQLKKFLAWGVELGKVRRDYKLAGACQLHASYSPGRRFMDELRTWPHWWDYMFEEKACSE